MPFTTELEVGIMFRRYPEVTVKQYYNMMKSVMAHQLPFEYTMSCGTVFGYSKFSEIPKVDTPCMCGNPRHYFVKYEIGG